MDEFLSAVEALYPGKSDEVELLDFSGHDEALANLCYACAEMVSEKTPGESGRVVALTRLFATFLAEKYIAAVAEKPDFHTGLPIWQLRKVEDYIRVNLGADISVQTLAGLLGLSLSSAQLFGNNRLSLVHRHQRTCTLASKTQLNALGVTARNSREPQTRWS